ncbi:MAG: rhomboid family intramembrane serine protease [Lachnospiraceae bacterium]|nr:rhomboid family intramembrane serine protease [Lachnospiraceae bacterium]
MTTYNNLFKQKIPFVTVAIVILNIIGLLYELSVGEDAAIYEFAMYEGALRDGEWARFIVSGFLHFGLYHFGSNMLCLVFFGISFEKRIGPVKYALIYLAALIGAGVMINFFGGEGIHAGASGGIWGLMCATLVLTIKNRQNPVYVGRGILFNLIYSFSAGVSWQGHIGGGIAGFIMACILLLGGKNNVQQRRQNELYNA